MASLLRSSVYAGCVLVALNCLIVSAQVEPDLPVLNKAQNAFLRSIDSPDVPPLTKEQSAFLRSLHVQAKSVELRGDDPPPSEETGELKCPNKEDIAPCLCSEKRGVLNAGCIGGNVTQEDVEKTISAIRSTNDLQSYDILKMESFQVSFTNLTSLDLTPLDSTEIKFLYILLNGNLTKITSQLSPRSEDPDTPASITATNLFIIWAPITDLGDTLRLFANKMNVLAVAYTRVTGSRPEFFSGLGSLTNLVTLNLVANNITGEIGGGQFRRNTGLNTISLSWNRITSVGMAAFPSSRSQTNLTVDLALTKLKDEGFKNMRDSGLVSNIRPTYLNLQLSSMETLSQVNFEPFLTANKDNKINLQLAQLKCNNNLSWLKANRATYESQVLNARCQNDRQRSVFDSKRIA